MVKDSAPEQFVVHKPDWTDAWNHDALHRVMPDADDNNDDDDDRRVPSELVWKCHSKEWIKISRTVILKYFWNTFIHISASFTNFFLSFVGEQ